MPEPISQPRFEQPWHAQILALTVALNEAGHLPWSEWTEAFGATLARHRIGRELDGGDDYFLAWLETLECVLHQRGLAETEQARALRDLWRGAYLSTPHGSPVRLPE